MILGFDSLDSKMLNCSLWNHPLGRKKTSDIVLRIRMLKIFGLRSSKSILNCAKFT